MTWFDREFAPELDLAECYRQNYEDALDEIRNLRFKIKELEVENDLLRKDIDRAENFILYQND